MSTTIEKRLEANFVKWCREQDIEPIKGPTATSKGFPDRFLQLPKCGGTIYVEFKGTSDYYDLTPLQQWWKEYLMKSNPNRYFTVSDDYELARLKKVCLDFMNVGSAIVEYEKNLFKVLNSQHINAHEEL